MNDDSSVELQNSLVRHLRCQGIDEPLARAFANAIVDHALTWRVESPCAADDCNAIMALAFGYQALSGGKRAPGVANEALAALVLNHYQRRPRPVYAQSEIAALLDRDLPARHFFPVNPCNSANGSHRGTSTESVAAEIARQVGDPKELAPWLLIAHRHHAVRCAVIANEKGFGPVVTPELPAVYDRNSAQVWRRRHLAYLVSDVISRFTMFVTNRLYPVILRSDSASLGDCHSEEFAKEATPVAAQPATDRSRIPYQDQLNVEVPLLGRDAVDYAAIPCYTPQHAVSSQSISVNSQQPAAQQRRGDWRDSTRTKPSRQDARATLREESIG